VQDFVTVLEQSGAGNISFNPITGPNLTKALTAIAESEGYSLDPDMAQGLVAGAGGDLRNAMQNLQLMLQGPGAVKAKAGAKKGKVSMRQVLRVAGTVHTK
jgi:DNA polymerase III delta prime subunit